MMNQSSFEHELLCCHTLGKAEYISHSKGASDATEQITKTDSAYATLESKGLVERIATITVMPFQGARAKNPFILTEKGVAERERVIRDESR